MASSARTVISWEEPDATMPRPSLVRSELSVEVVSNRESFQRLEPVWNRLFEESETELPFLSYEWMRAWWESFGETGRGKEGKQLHILVVRDAEGGRCECPRAATRRHDSHTGRKVR